MKIYYTHKVDITNLSSNLRRENNSLMFLLLLILEFSTPLKSRSKYGDDYLKKNDSGNNTRSIVCSNNLPVHVVKANSVFNFRNLLNNTDLSAYLHCN